MIKFAIKVGIATAAVYYINEQGVWKPSNESIKTYQKLKEIANPYIQELASQIPYEIPKLPESNVMSTVIKEGWNKGVLTTFKFIYELPDNTTEWTSKGIDSIKQNEDVKKFLDSFS